MKTYEISPWCWFFRLERTSFDGPLAWVEHKVYPRRFDAAFAAASDELPGESDGPFCTGEDEVEIPARIRWDEVEAMKRTFDHLGSRFGVDLANDGDEDLIADAGSEDLLDIIRAQDRLDEEADFQANVRWSEVRVTRVDPATLSRKRGRELTSAMRAKNEQRSMREAWRITRENRLRLVSMIEALGGDPAAPEVVEWVQGCIRKRSGSKARGYALAIEKLERRQLVAA